jgi:hypothetical protein
VPACDHLGMSHWRGEPWRSTAFLTIPVRPCRSGCRWMPRKPRDACEGRTLHWEFSRIGMSLGRTSGARCGKATAPFKPLQPCVSQSLGNPFRYSLVRLSGNWASRRLARLNVPPQWAWASEIPSKNEKTAPDEPGRSISGFLARIRLAVGGGQATPRVRRARPRLAPAPRR